MSKVSYVSAYTGGDNHEKAFFLLENENKRWEVGEKALAMVLTALVNDLEVDVEGKRGRNRIAIRSRPRQQ